MPPIELVAEVGTTGQSSVETALKLADAVKASGADAIKWMIQDPDELMADQSVTYTYRWAGGERTENMAEMMRGLRFGKAELQRVTDHCTGIGLPWYATVDHLKGVEIGEALGCPRYKLSAWDIRNFPLIRAMAETKKPMQIDLGPSLEGEIVTVLGEIRQINPNAEIMLVHSTHSEDLREYNLWTIPYLSDVFRLQVGWSAPDRHWGPDSLAVAAGACLVEKRITLDRKQEGHHHILALEPKEFERWVRAIRTTEAQLGRFGVYLSLTDLRMKDPYFTSIHAAQDILEGETITSAILCAKRPGKGISPLYMNHFCGKQAKWTIPKDTYLRWEDV